MIIIVESLYAAQVLRGEHRRTKRSMIWTLAWLECNLAAACSVVITTLLFPLFIMLNQNEG